MSEVESIVAERRPGSRLVPLVGAVILLVALAVGAWVVYGPGRDILTPPVKKVGSIDQEAILGLPEFKKAQEELQNLAKKKEAEFKAQVQREKLDPEAQRVVYERMQLELQQQRNKLLGPLHTRAEAAVATVARQKGMTVVLDKRIVVVGVEDITDEVKKVFQTPGEIKIPAELDTSTSPVAYFDQEVVRNLKVFQEVDLKLFQARAELMKEFERRRARLSQAEQEQLFRELSARFETMKEAMLAPMLQKVTSSVREVAQAQGIALVLDKQHVMYGGRNITDSVVETFLKKVAADTGEGVGSSPASPPASPAASPGR
ncbi:MAG TPA: OmpH family outer membrane protein [Candidatus Nitrosotenuis sp.]|jgi:outer membrane protein|nr:OmpH family outer membrane protein [Candidatus Nitrosotenuis sp.]